MFPSQEDKVNYQSLFRHCSFLEDQLKLSKESINDWKQLLLEQKEMTEIYKKLWKDELNGS